MVVKNQVDEDERFVKGHLNGNACLCEREKRAGFVVCWHCDRELSAGVKSRLIAHKRAKNWHRLSAAMDEALSELQEAGRI